MSNAQYPYIGDFKYLDENGFPACPGNGECPGPCDESCPIMGYEMSKTAFYVEHDKAKALDLVKKAIVRIPDEAYPKAWYWYGCLCMTEGVGHNTEDAKSAFAFAFSYNRHDRLSARGALHAMVCQGKFDEALKHCDFYARNFDFEEHTVERWKKRIMYLKKKYRQ